MRPRPYFERLSSSLGSRLLIISWHFPPSQAAGALRWQKFVRYATERGFTADVIALAPELLKNPDFTRLEELPEGLRAFGQTAPQPRLDRLSQHVATLVRKVRSGEETREGRQASAGRSREPRGPNVTSVHRSDVSFRPTHIHSWLRAFRAWREHAAEGAWARMAARFGERLHEEEPFRAVITCGPPHMVHEAGRLLERRLRIPFVMDMRDPWRLQERLIDHVASPVWLWLARRLEARAVERASLIVCNTEPFRRAMQTVYPEKPAHILAVMNGFDEEPLPDPPSNGPFVIAYAGSIYLNRDPRPLLRAARRVIAELDLGPADFRIELVGNVDDYGGVPLNEMAREEGIAAHVRTGPFLRRTEVMRFLARATMLVSLPQDSNLAIPSKVFEYLRFPAWILAMTDRDSATAEALRGTHADVVPPDDIEGLAQVIRRRYHQYVERGRPAPVAEGAGKRLSRRRQAERLFAALEERIGEA